MPFILFFASVLSFALFTPPAAAADTDALANEQMLFESGDGARVLESTAQDVRRIFEIYEPAVDSSSRVVSAKVLSGSAQQPRLEVGIRACVLIICRTVQLDSEIVIQPVAGTCQKNLRLTADLRRSTPLLADHFDALNVDICLNTHAEKVWRNTGSSRYDLSFAATAHHASQYSSGPVAWNALRMLKLQTPPMLRALNQALVENGAQNLKTLP